MTQSPGERAVDGAAEAQSVELGEPARIDEERTRGPMDDRERPNLDQREDRISTERKPSGPPLERGGPPREEDLPPENPEGPTDPS